MVQPDVSLLEYIFYGVLALGFLWLVRAILGEKS